MLRDSGEADNFAALITGELGVNDHDCVTLRGSVVFAMPGSTAGDGSVTLDGYGTFAIGDTVTVGGGEEDGVPVEQLSGTERECFDPGDSTVSYIVMSP